MQIQINSIRTPKDPFANLDPDPGTIFLIFFLIHNPNNLFRNLGKKYLYRGRVTRFI